MPVRFRITLLFSLLVFIILGIVCTGVYFFSYKARINAITTRLTNRSITTATLLSQREVFDQTLIRKIDSSTTITLKNKTVQAYDVQNRKIYNYSDVPGDTLTIDDATLDKTRSAGTYYFLLNDKEAVAYNYTNGNTNMVVVSAAEDEEGRQSLHSLLWILIYSFLIGNIFVLVAGYFFSKGLIRPVKKITEDVADISAQNLTRRIQTGTTRDEWYELSSTLNELLDRLQESFELQRRFVANASHELSTPLTSISSQLEVSMQRKRDAEEYLKVMQSVYQDVLHMNKLTQTLLEFAKASGSTGGLEINLVRMDEIVLKLPSEVIKASSLFSVKLEFDNLPEDEEKLLVFGNEALLLTAIKNIAVNACKYSPDHRATVKLNVVGQNITVSIEDTGIGISEEEKKKIFQPFYRSHEGRQAEGFGLGLSLAEKIVKIHKGNIAVDSKIGQGTTFTVSFPSAGSIS